MRRETIDICYDARMILSAGIGTYIRNILLHLLNNTNLKISVIVWPDTLKALPWINNFDEVIT